MDNNFSVDFKGDHIHIEHGESFEISSESMNGFWTMLADVCEQFGCNRVFATGPAPKREMDTVGAFRSGVQAAESVPSLWLAICFSGYETDELSELFKHAARNRGVHVKFFDDKEQAHRWLGVGVPGAGECGNDLAA